jgi:TRAP-type C4-dicarboxylate transport system substrate-binding protein
MTIRTTFVAATLAAGLALPAAGTELKFANFTPPAHTINASVIEVLNTELSGATGGALTVRGYHGGELGAGPAEQYVRVVQGVAARLRGDLARLRQLCLGVPGHEAARTLDL